MAKASRGLLHKVALVCLGGACVLGVLWSLFVIQRSVYYCLQYVEQPFTRESFMCDTLSCVGYGLTLVAIVGIAVLTVLRFSGHVTRIAMCILMLMSSGTSAMVNVVVGIHIRAMVFRVEIPCVRVQSQQSRGITTWDVADGSAHLIYEHDRGLILLYPRLSEQTYLAVEAELEQKGIRVVGRSHATPLTIEGE